MGFNIDNFQNEIQALCEQLAVARLDLFGSATTDEFNDESDLDFVVDFQPNQSNLLDRFLALQNRLQKLFNRRIDLITRKSIRNPYLKTSIERTRKNVFASYS
ncbi:MAG: nucleotidyltransferase family protein [Candidatus Rifleibacteriota bacterium]